MSKKKVLIVDDELNIRRILQAAFDKHGWVGLTAENAVEAMSIIKGEQIDCVLTDVTMPGQNGYELQKEIYAYDPNLPVVIMTAFGTIPQAVQAIRSGAFEFVSKPFDLEALKKVINAALTQEAISLPIKKSTPKSTSGVTFIAESPAMSEIKAMIDQVADSRATVLITGESGTGKEVIAKLIHAKSQRSEKPFVAVSCAALPETLLESELFGHEKGAFTGADSAKPGRFELAEAGSLFLDEIGEIPLQVQVKLLRVLQEREFERLGATKPTKADVRLITATNRDLQEAVDEGIFRLDLMYRLQVVEIHLPPLRERQEDIPALCEHFLKRASDDNGRSLVHLSDEAKAILTSYRWPGNVRELENTMERAVVLSRNEETHLLPTHLPPKLRSAA